MNFVTPMPIAPGRHGSAARYRIDVRRVGYVVTPNMVMASRGR